MPEEQTEQLLTIKEFAERAGVSTQAIYAACKGRLQPFCKQVGKKTKLFATGLQIYQPSDTSTSQAFEEEIVQPFCNQDCKPSCKVGFKNLQPEIAKLQAELQGVQATLQEREQLLTAYKEEVETLQQSLTDLRQQVTAKDRQIADLTSLLQAAQQSTQAALQATGQAQLIAYQTSQNVAQSRTGGLIARLKAYFQSGRGQS
jgi:septal ring factor EnvC (AmiA/AmiB activator)